MRIVRRARTGARRTGLGLVVLLLNFALGIWTFPVGAAAPTLDHLFPVAVTAGTTSTVTAIGKFDPWPPKVWLDAPGIRFNPETNNGRYTVEVAAEVPLGPHLVRTFNEQGASALRFLIVTREPQTSELEPNDDFAKPQRIETLPASVNGRLEKGGDVDSFAIALEAGQTLIATVEAFTLASPVDAVVRVVDAQGVPVAWNHDGRTFDPELAWTARSNGAYVVQVFGFAYPAESDVRFTGNARCVYRLNLSRGPYLRHTMPLGVQRGRRMELKLAGWNLPSGWPRAAEFDGTTLSALASKAPWRTEFENVLQLPVGDGPELLEQEPNETSTNAQPLQVPGAITGCLDKLGDQDRFSFTAAKGEKYVLELQAATLGFPVDARLRLENSQGKEVAQNDDSGGPDPRLEWTIGEGGRFVVIVDNVLHRGGPDYLYRLSVRKAVPAAKVTVPDTAFSVAPGKTNEIKVTVKRLHEHRQNLTLTVKGLEEGVVAAPVEVGEKATEATIRLAASSEAKPFSGPIQIVATEMEGKEQRVVAELTSSTVNNGVPGGFSQLVIDATDQFWLTVLPAPASAADGGGKK